MDKKRIQITECCGSKKFKRLDQWVVECKKCKKKTLLIWIKKQGGNV